MQRGVKWTVIDLSSREDAGGPVRLHSLEKVLHRHQWWPRTGRVEITFGKPLQPRGTDYSALGRNVEGAVRYESGNGARLGPSTSGQSVNPKSSRP